MIQAQTSASEVLRTMIFTEIELFNIRQFDRKHFEFNNGFNLLLMDHFQGKSTLLQSMRSVLSTSPADSIGIQKDGTSESKIAMKFKMDSKSYTAVKQWAGKALTSHDITLDGSDHYFNLCDIEDLVHWYRLFLGIYDKRPVADDHADTDHGGFLRYQLFLSLIFPGMEIDDVVQKNWQHEFFNVSCYDKIENGVMQLHLAASAKLSGLKAARQAVANEQINFLRFEQELMKIDPEIKRMETLISQLSDQTGGNESELQQAEKIHDFILTRKNEIEKIDFELRSYGSLLKHNIAGEFTEDEIFEIEKKRRIYEQILTREESLNQKLIERGHLEKNLNGILNEISQMQITPDTMNSSGLNRIDAFKDEVARIKGALKAYGGIENELDSLKKEKFLYKSSYDKFHVISKLKQIISQNEQKKIRSSVEKLEQDRKELELELVEMRSSVHEDRYRELLGKVHQKRQQILEYRKRLDELYAARLDVLGNYEAAKHEMQDLSILEGNIRKQITQKKYLSMAGEVSRFIQDELLNGKRAEFVKYLDGLSGFVSGSFIRLASQLLTEGGWSYKAMLEDQYSGSEIADFIQIFRLICLDYHTRIEATVLDEHSRRILDAKQINRINDILTHFKIRQTIVFEKI